MSDSGSFCIRDVAIIGGGASGTYAAVRLREDFNKAVILIEQRNKLGGNVNTFIDATSGSSIPVEYGAIAYLDDPVSRKFFARFDVPQEPWTLPAPSEEHIDFATGEKVECPHYSDDEIMAALSRYTSLIQPYAVMTSPAYTKLPDTVPMDLYKPFGDFIKKHQLEPIVPIVWQFCFTAGDLLDASLLSVLSIFNLPQLAALRPGGFFQPRGNDNSEIYRRALASLGQDVLRSTTVVSAKQNGGIYIVNLSDGSMIKARKLLVTMPPTISNLQPLNLEDHAQDIFDKWVKHHIYVAVVQIDGIPADTTFLNTATSTPWNLPDLPFIWAIEKTKINGTFVVKVISADDLEETVVKSMVESALENIKTAGTFAIANVSIRAFARHSPLMFLPRDMIKKGMYREMYGLQGREGVYYAGNAFAGDYSSFCWQYVEEVLPLIVKDLEDDS